MNTLREEIHSLHARRAAEMHPEDAPVLHIRMSCTDCYRVHAYGSLRCDCGGTLREYVSPIPAEPTPKWWMRIVALLTAALKVTES